MSKKTYERFGKYLILDHLVDGGMAKICRARFLGEQANKLVAVKMIQEQFSKDPNFVRMFEDELKVCFALQHPNIGQTYDYGKVNGQLFTAMELLEGANLKEFLDRLAEKKYVFPVEISVYITSQICQGLHYSHNYKDPLTNKLMNIVHRDISPHNVMLTYDGAVKVIDFGIAKAESNSEQTQAGTIKGKLSYLAPEYLEGLTLDHRYDQFAVGITIWELLCSRRLFSAKNDLACLKLIQQCKVPPPSSINPNVPKELDQIVMKALDKDRTLRYDDMDKLNRALIKFLYSTYPDFNPTDLSYFAHELFKEEILINEKKYTKYGEIDIKPFLQELKDEAAGIAPKAKPAEGSAKEEVVAKVEVQEFEFSEEDMGLEVEVEKTGDSTSIRRQVPNAGGEEKTQTRKIQRSVRSKTNTSLRNPGLKSSGTKTNIRRQKMQKVQEKKSGGNMGKVAMGLIAGFAAIVFFKADMVYNMTGIDLSFISGKQSRTIANNNTTTPVNGETRKVQRVGTLNLRDLDVDMEVYLDGRKLSYVQGNIDVKLNKMLHLKVEKKGHIPFYHKFKLSPSKSAVTVAVPALAIAKIGLLSTSMNYSGFRMVLKVNGVNVERALPVKAMRIPAGIYDATIINDLLGTEKKVHFQIKENKKFFLE